MSCCFLSCCHPSGSRSRPVGLASNYVHINFKSHTRGTELSSTYFCKPRSRSTRGEDQKKTLPSSTCWPDFRQFLANLWKGCERVVGVQTRRRTVIQRHDISCAQNEGQHRGDRKRGGEERSIRADIVGCTSVGFGSSLGLCLLMKRNDQRSRTSPLYLALRRLGSWGSKVWVPTLDITVQFVLVGQLWNRKFHPRVLDYETETSINHAMSSPWLCTT